MLVFSNSLSKKKELFAPLQFPRVNMYVCGITPYAPTHLGHGRCYVTFDLLYRVLTYLKYDVIYCRNFTDVDDKLISKAIEEFGDKNKFSTIADKYIHSFHEDTKKLNCITPQHEPRVTAHIPEIISFIEKLIKKNHAYESNGSVYFHVRSFAGYGKLSKQKIDDMQCGERVATLKEKKDLLDFALWKKEEDNSFWKSPWGFGRPGWHIECSALALHYLGKHIDIHGGGLDLIFPHHDNEIAQSESLIDGSFARFWIHNGFVQIDQEKMSKSIGNTMSLEELFSHIDPMVVRFYLLNHQYRMPMDFSYDALASVEKSYERICKLFYEVEPIKLTHEKSSKIPIIDRMLSLLFDDLNTPGMIGVFFESIEYLKANKYELSCVKYIFTEVLGLKLIPLQKNNKATLTPEIEALIQDRKKAREKKDWQQADAIRDKLLELGLEIQDKKLK